MKTINHSKAIRLIEKFDKQLKDILAEELLLARAAKNNILNSLKQTPSGESYSFVKAQ